jgi:hypothetical protein
MGDGGLNVAALENPIKPWENVIWTPEPLFKSETVFCVASGPSLTQEIADKLKGRRVIVVNSSCHFAPWADVLYFTDSGWYDTHKGIVRDWPGLVVSMSRQAKRELDDPAVNTNSTPRVLRVKGYGDPSFPPRVRPPDGSLPKVPGFPPLGSPEIQQGRNSGNTAVSLAIALGAARVCLIGYDCRVVNGREHCHNDYKGPRDLSLYENEFQKAFNGWNEAALASCVEILNCTHGSAITEFPFADLDEVLNVQHR